MAGRGLRLAGQGYQLPKPLIPVAGRPMVVWALHSLKDLHYTSLIFIIYREHERKYGLTQRMQSLVEAPIEVIQLEQVTEGQLCSVLAASEIIDTEEDLLIASAD
ncbi:unnamed protein product, partial [marine sediment metagenome]